MTISLSSKVQDVIDALVNGTIDPIIDPGDGKIYVLDIENRELGTIRYTTFDPDTRYPEKSYAVKYGHQHTIHQILYASMIRTELTTILTQEIPGMIRSDFEPMIIPALTKVYPITIQSKKNTRKIL